MGVTEIYFRFSPCSAKTLKRRTPHNIFRRHTTLRKNMCDPETDRPWFTAWTSRTTGLLPRCLCSERNYTLRFCLCRGTEERVGPVDYSRN